MAFKGLKKFSGTKQENEVVSDVLPGQMDMDEYMHQTFGCDAVSAEELPSDTPSLSVIFDFKEVH